MAFTFNVLKKRVGKTIVGVLGPDKMPAKVNISVCMSGMFEDNPDSILTVDFFENEEGEPMLRVWGKADAKSRPSEPKIWALADVVGKKPKGLVGFKDLAHDLEVKGPALAEFMATTVPEQFSPAPHAQ